MADLLVDVANCPVSGQRWTETVEGDYRRRRRNHLQFVVSGWTIDWYQNAEFHDLPSAKRYDLRGDLVPTSHAIVRNVPMRRFRSAKTTVSDICWLLRLASMSAVTPYQTTYRDRIHRWAVAAQYHEFRAPIDMRDGKVVESSIHSCWPAYRRLKATRQLDVPIDYLVYADGASIPVEAKLLLAYTAIEHLKTTWAKSTGVPWIAGYFREPDMAGNATRKSPRLSFEALVTAMLSDVRMRSALRRIVRVRNQLIHTGIATGTGYQKFERYGTLVGTIQRYLFRLLGYRGHMIDYATLQLRAP